MMDFMDLNKREKYGLMVFVIIIISVIAVFYYRDSRSTAIEVIGKKPTQEKTEKSEGIENNTISAYICGEITKPGVYALNEGDRLFKLIEIAGGFTQKSDKEAINLSEKLTDEAFIKIPSVEEVEVGNKLTSTTSSNVTSGKININRATLEELKELPRIGDAIAQRIIDYIKENGSFKAIEELNNVSGIGDKIYEGLKDKITIR
jgi:competence protein ComEA